MHAIRYAHVIPEAERKTKARTELSTTPVDKGRGAASNAPRSPAIPF